MLTEYDIHQAARDRRAQLEREYPTDEHYAHENAARRNVRLKAERTTRSASKLDAYIAKRRRELGAQGVLDVAEQTRPYDWERDIPASLFIDVYGSDGAGI